MTLHVLGQDESIAVAPGGRVRIVAPDHASTSGGDGGRDAADRVERLHGYVVRGEVTAAPALIARGLVEGTTWEELHADLVSLGDDDIGDDLLVVVVVVVAATPSAAKAVDDRLT